jgi:hypothetical protein
VFGIFASLDSDMDHAPMYYRSHTIILLMTKGLAILLPCMRMLRIHSCDVLLSYMWYTKQILFCPYPCFCLVEMLSSSYPPSNPLWMDLSYDIVSLLVIGLPVEPLHESETPSISKGISNVIIVN